MSEVETIIIAKANLKIANICKSSNRRYVNRYERLRSLNLIGLKRDKPDRFEA